MPAGLRGVIWRTCEARECFWPMAISGGASRAKVGANRTFAKTRCPAAILPPSVAHRIPAGVEPELRRLPGLQFTVPGVARASPAVANDRAATSAGSGECFGYPTGTGVTIAPPSMSRTVVAGGSQPWARQSIILRKQSPLAAARGVTFPRRCRFAESTGRAQLHQSSATVSSGGDIRKADIGTRRAAIVRGAGGGGRPAPLAARCRIDLREHGRLRLGPSPDQPGIGDRGRADHLAAREPGE